MSAKPQATVVAPPVRRESILLVDDDPGVRLMLGRVLAEEGYTVLSASNGAEALGIATANHIDLALLDLNMPVKNGWDTFERLTARDPLLAVIIITARSNQFFTALGAGVGALLEKPLDFPTLLKTVERLLAESAQLRLARIAGRHGQLYFLPSTGKRFLPK